MSMPYVHINCAATLDGKIARPDGSRLRISGEDDMRRVHLLRAEIGAVLVGVGTVIEDNPKLAVKKEMVEDPPEIVKIVLDGKGKVPLTSRFLRTPGRSLVVTGEHCDREWLDRMLEIIDVEGLDAEVLVMDDEGRSGIDLRKLLEELKDMGVDGIMVEGGSDTIWSFISEGLYDVLTIYIGPMMIGGKGPTIMGGPGLDVGTFDMELDEVLRTDDGGILLRISHVRDQ